MSLLTTLIPLLSQSTTKLVIELNGEGDGRVKAIVSPLVGEMPENASEEQRKLKAALAMPLRCIGSPSVIEEDLADHVRKYVWKRNEWEARLQALDEATPKVEQKDKPDSKSNNGSESVDEFEEVEFDL